MEQLSSSQYPKPGDLVKCNYDFAEERVTWKLNYPKKGDYLIVSQFLYSVTHQMSMLYFEYPYLSTPLDASRFDLVQDEVDGDEILNEAYKIANKL